MKKQTQGVGKSLHVDKAEAIAIRRVVVKLNSLRGITRKELKQSMGRIFRAS